MHLSLKLILLCLRYASIGLIVLWIIYVLGAFLGNRSDSSNGVWAIIWCVINIACFAGVLYGLTKKNMRFLIPALFLCIFNIIVGIINTLVNFITLNWFAAVWLLVIVGLTVYYALGLLTLLDQPDEGESPAAEEPAAPAKNQNGVIHV